MHTHMVNVQFLNDSRENKLNLPSALSLARKIEREQNGLRNCRCFERVLLPLRAHHSELWMPVHHSGVTKAACVTPCFYLMPFLLPA